LRKQTIREVAAWTAVSGYEHCVQLFETFWEQRFCFMVMEECRCSVLQELDDIANVSEGDTARVFHEMLLGVAHLHDKGFVHRDIKPANFLLGDSQGDVVKLCDFGLAIALPRHGKLYGTCGTAPYKAPEMLKGCGYLEKVDVWSLGVTAYLILFGEFPYVPQMSGQRFEEVVLKGEPSPTYDRGTDCNVPSSQATDFVRAMLCRSVRGRCTVAEALQSPFIREHAHSSECLTTRMAEYPSASLKDAIGKARQRTQEFDAPVDPTEQRNIQEIMELLGGSALSEDFATSHTVRKKIRHFSDGFTGPCVKLKRGHAEDSSRSQLSKSRTHCGTLTMEGEFLWRMTGRESLLDADADDTSQSTQSGTSSESKMCESCESQELDSPCSDSLSWNMLPHAIAT
jgi:serine/threonine protein kinase